MVEVIYSICDKAAKDTLREITNPVGRSAQGHNKTILLSFSYKFFLKIFTSTLFLWYYQVLLFHDLCIWVYYLKKTLREDRHCRIDVTFLSKLQIATVSWLFRRSEDQNVVHIGSS